MNEKLLVATVILGALLFTGLFYNNDLGLNLVIFELLFFGWLLCTKQFRFVGINPIGLGIALPLTALFTVFVHSTFSYVVNFLVVFVFAGVLAYPQVRSLLNAMLLAFHSMVASQFRFVRELFRVKSNGRRLGSYLWQSRLFVVPSAITGFFAFIYKNSNPIFEATFLNASQAFWGAWNGILGSFEIAIFFTFLWGLPICSFLVVRVSNDRIEAADLQASEELKRTKCRHALSFSMIALKNECKAGVFMFLLLNLLLGALNMMEIKLVWFGFEWEGQYLKDFVHEGTYLLIFSIVISTVLVLYFFRGNLNFYRQNTLLRYLCYIWLVQNGILAVSAAIRNYWYIHYFSLAYKRIGVYLFLVLAAYGLYSVLQKVRFRKSAFFLIKANVYVLFVVLVASSAVNWEVLVAQYNFKHAGTSFLHLDYMATLPDKTLPYLDKSMEDLSRLDSLQIERFPFKRGYMPVENYHRVIELRKQRFVKKWEAKSWLEWNLPEYLAYKKLKMP